MKRAGAVMVIAALLAAAAPGPARAEGNVSIGVSVAATVALGWFFITVSEGSGGRGWDDHKKGYEHHEHERRGRHESRYFNPEGGGLASLDDADSARTGRADEKVAVIYPVRPAY